MIKKWLIWIVLAFFVATALGAGGPVKKIELTYSLLLEDGQAANVLEGLESGDGFRLALKPGQDCFAYVVVQHDPDDFRVLFPEKTTRRGKNEIAGKEKFVWPQDGWLRLDRRRGTEKIYLILAAERIYELEAYQTFGKHFPESVLLDIRDRYHVTNSYVRKIGDDAVKIKFKSREKKTAVLIEEIALRHL